MRLPVYLDIRNFFTILIIIIAVILDQTRFCFHLLLNRKNGKPFNSIKNSLLGNYIAWNYYLHWKHEGDEWTQDASLNNKDPLVWKNEILELISHYAKNNSNILEIGPGSGRWTRTLTAYAQKLYLADISDKCLKICREKFPDKPLILIDSRFKEYNFIPSGSIDFIWSYDVFVHLNPKEIGEYFELFGRILKQDGTAIIHHIADFPSFFYRIYYHRSHTDNKIIMDMLRKHHLRLVEQKDAIAHFKGDTVSIIRKELCNDNNQILNY